MNIYSLIAAFRDAIHDNAALSAWCVTNYGQAHNVYVGVDRRNPPTSDNYPAIAIYPERKSQGLSVANMGHVFSVNCALSNDDSRAIVGKTRITEMAGVYDLSYFTAAVIDIVADNCPDGLFLDSAGTEWDDIDIFPEFITRSTLTINRPEYQGADSFD